jgi:DNA-binding CsgD family transcriptional regulator
MTKANATGFYKGRPCIVNHKNLCQEGYCSECWIWRSQQPMQLTLREHEIALLISQGLINKEIAFRLNIKENTVKNHITNIFIKHGCTKRVQIALLYSHELNLGVGI